MTRSVGIDLTLAQREARALRGIAKMMEVQSVFVRNLSSQIWRQKASNFFPGRLGMGCEPHKQPMIEISRF